ncbi:MAG: LytTR family transcriptional regulator [Chromatiales bacterium]|nr:MAG: LytTR family transcriptional regulator [Chromatiales bacterium]
MVEKQKDIELSEDGALAKDTPPADILSTPFTEWNWRLILFYLGVPGIIAVYAALNNWAVLQVAGYAGTLLFYAGHAFIPWWTTCLLTYLCMRLLARWRPRQLLILTLGTVLACVVILPYSIWLTESFAAGWLPGDATGELSSLHIYEEIGFWSFTLRASVIWIAVNLVFDRFLGLPRYRYDVPATQAAGLARTSAADSTFPGAADIHGSAAAHEPRFLQRLPAQLAVDDVIALKAEQHYVKVYTHEKSFMTLYRFSDAVAEMDPEAGRQVHRSYWVRTSAIRRLKRAAKKFELELVNDLTVPVSGPNNGLVRRLAQTHDIPVHPPL